MHNRRKVASESPLPLPESVKRYWFHLLPVVLFPSFAVIFLKWGFETWRIVAFFVLFAIISIYSGLPIIRNKVKMSYWYVACVLFIGGGMLAIPVLIIAHV